LHATLSDDPSATAAVRTTDGACAVAGKIVNKITADLKLLDWLPQPELLPRSLCAKAHR